MNFTDTMIHNNIRNQLNKQYVAPLVLCGPVGSMKSTLFKDYAAEHGMNILNKSMALVTSDYLMGLPIFKDRDGDKVTVWSMPEIIDRANELAKEKDTLILLDDIHALQGDDQSIMLELLLERKVHDYRLADNVAIVGTMNDSAEAGVDGLLSSVRNRIALLNYKFDFDQWFKLYGSKLDPRVSSFVSIHKNYMEEVEQDDLSGFGTSRSMAFMSECIRGLDDQFVIDNAMQISKQFISDEASVEFASHINYYAKVDFKGIILSKKDINIVDMSVVDKILYSYLVHHLKTESDGEWFIKLLKQNKTETLFIGLALALVNSKSDENNEAIDTIISYIVNGNDDFNKILLNYIF